MSAILKTRAKQNSSKPETLHAGQNQPPCYINRLRSVRDVTKNLKITPKIKSVTDAG